jgi:hypothetical protein
MGLRSPLACACETFFMRLGSTKKPFFMDRVMGKPYLSLLPFRRTSICELDGFDFFLVGKPFDN